MYRAGIVERREAVLAARSRLARHLEERIARGIARARAMELETRLSALMSRAPDDLDALQALEADVAALDRMAQTLDAEWSDYGVLGAPPAAARPYAADWVAPHLDAHDPDKERILLVLDRGAVRVAAELPRPPLVDLRMPMVALHFRFDGVPIRADVSAATTDTPGEYRPVTRVQIAVSSSYGPMSARAQTLGDDVLGALRLRTDPTFDDPAFDGAYFVRGEQRDLQSFFGPAVRRALVRLTREAPARFTVEGGIASIDLEARQRIRTVCKVLAAVRKTSRVIHVAPPPVMAVKHRARQ